jgi:hypothetical protein
MSGRESHPQMRDCVRIVPLATPDAAERAAAVAQSAQLVYNNGPLIARAEVFTIFWGSAWQQAPLAGLISEVNRFFDYILTSVLIDQLGEYSAAQYQIGHGKSIGSITLTSPDLSKTVDDSAIQQLIQREVSTGKLPPASLDLIYFVFLPSGVTVTQGGSASCKVFCGYHDALSNEIFYAVMPFPDCSDCSSGLSSFDALTVTASHELCEAITDPVPGKGWYDNQNGEIGDICAWQTKRIGQYTVQKEWSNKASGCI